MRRNKPVYYWDTTLFLAWIKNEPRKPGEMEGLREVVRMVDRNEAIITTSVITKGEILKSTLTQKAIAEFENLFKRPTIVRVDLTEEIADLSSEIRDYYNGTSGKLTLPDAQHLATAIAYQVRELQTFDEEDLIAKNGNVAGHSLTICKPRGPQGELF